MTVDNRYDGRGSEPPYESIECIEMRERTTAMVIELEQLEKQNAALTARLVAAEHERDDDRAAVKKAGIVFQRIGTELVALNMPFNDATEQLTTLRGLLREVREAYRTGYVSDVIPHLRLLYLSDRFDTEAKAALEGKQ